MPSPNAGFIPQNMAALQSLVASPIQPKPIAPAPPPPLPKLQAAAAVASAAAAVQQQHQQQLGAPTLRIPQGPAPTGPIFTQGQQQTLLSPLVSAVTAGGIPGLPTLVTAPMAQQQQALATVSTSIAPVMPAPLGPSVTYQVPMPLQIDAQRMAAVAAAAAAGQNPFVIADNAAQQGQEQQIIETIAID